MKIEFDVNLFVHFVQPPNDPVLAAIDKQGKQIMSAIDNLKAQVARHKTVSDSAVALLQGLKEKLDEAIESGDMDAVQELSDSLAVETTELADAVTANTPADTGTTPTDPTIPADGSQQG